MFKFWNEFELKRPPLVTLPTNTKFVGLVPAVNRYFQRHSQEETEFGQTAALLSRLMARRKNSFHRMIGFRAIRKLNVALCRLLRVDLPRDLELFRGALPDISLDDDDVAELPTRNYLDYVLVRLIGVHHLHQRIRGCCIEAADYFAKMLRNNFFLEINTLLLAVFAKLHSLSAPLGNKCVELYRQLLPHRGRFPQSGNYTFLPSELRLPSQLEMFVNAQLTNDEVPTPTTGSIQMSSQLPSTPVVVSKFQLKEDMGTAISRESNQPAAFDIGQLTTIAAVKRFIATETKKRKQSPHNCITKKVLDHEWAGAQKLLERKILANEHKKALSIFRKFISSKI